MYNGKLNKNYLSTKVHIPNPDSVVKELRHVHLECYVCLNVLKATLSVSNIVCCGWRVKVNYNRVKEQKGCHQYRNRLLENTGVYFNTLKHPKETINQCIRQR